MTAGTVGAGARVAARQLRRDLSQPQLELDRLRSWEILGFASIPRCSMVGQSPISIP